MGRKMNFPENLRKYRKSRRISQTELADFVGISQRTISHYENGSAEPSLITLCQIADYLNVSLDDLVGRNK